MIVAVDPSKHVPIYEQIVEHIRGAVASGMFRPGEVLPSIRALALELVVNPNTVQRAYQELERRGLAVTRKGLGVFVADGAGDVARRGIESTVTARFVHGIEVGRGGKVGDDRMRALFQKALDDPEKPSAARDAGKRESSTDVGVEP